MWGLYTEARGSGNGTKICTNLKESLIMATEGKRTIEFLSDHFIIPNNTVEEIDWKAIKLAREGKNFFTNRWESRWAIGTIPTGTEMEDRNAWDSAACPRNCGEQMETPEHVYQCKKADQLWSKAKQILIEWAWLNKAKPGLVPTLLSGISQWRTYDEPNPSDVKEPELVEAFNHQTGIGWDCATKGILSHKWSAIQQRYFQTLGSSQSGKRFIAALIKKL